MRILVKTIFVKLCKSINYNIAVLQNNKRLNVKKI